MSQAGRPIRIVGLPSPFEDEENLRACAQSAPFSQFSEAAYSLLNSVSSTVRLPHATTYRQQDGR
jgi:hypothetical protein